MPSRVAATLSTSLIVTQNSGPGSSFPGCCPDGCDGSADGRLLCGYLSIPAGRDVGQPECDQTHDDRLAQPHSAHLTARHEHLLGARAHHHVTVVTNGLLFLSIARTGSRVNNFILRHSDGHIHHTITVAVPYHVWVYVPQTIS